MTNLLRTENSSKPCDTGTPVSILSEEFPNVDFSGVDPVYPDKTSARGAQYSYSRSALLSRAQRALEALHQRSEKGVVVVVSHSGFLRQALTGYWFFNADFRIFEFDKNPQESQEQKLVLKQSNLTLEGGLGWSWKDPVPIGDGLPEKEENIPKEDRKLPPTV